MTSPESPSTPISRGGWKYDRNDAQDRTQFAGHTAAELRALAGGEHGYDFSNHLEATQDLPRWRIDPTGQRRLQRCWWSWPGHMALNMRCVQDSGHTGDHRGPGWPSPAGPLSTT